METVFKDLEESGVMFTSDGFIKFFKAVLLLKARTEG